MSDSDCLCALLASLGGGAELLVDLRNIDIESPNGLSPYLPMSRFSITGR